MDELLPGHRQRPPRQQPKRKAVASDGAYLNRINNACEVALDGNERSARTRMGHQRHARQFPQCLQKLLLGGGPRERRQRRRHHHHTTGTWSSRRLARATMTFLDDNRDVMAIKKLSGANEQTFTVHSLTRCPAGTLPYHKGSHCCKFPLDLNGQPLTYNSNHCKSHQYIECPGGAVDGRCADDYEDRVLGAYKDTRNRAMRRGPKRYGYNVESCQNACKEYNTSPSSTTAGAPARTTRPTRPSTAHPRATAWEVAGATTSTRTST